MVSLADAVGVGQPNYSIKAPGVLSRERGVGNQQGVDLEPFLSASSSGFSLEERPDGCPDLLVDGLYRQQVAGLDALDEQEARPLGEVEIGDLGVL